MLALCFGFAVSAEAQQPGTVLKGRVEDATKIQRPTLTRTDLRPNKNSDPFSGEEDDEALDAPSSAFKADTVRPAQQQRPFNLGVGDQGYQNPMAARPQSDLGGEPDNIPMQLQQPMQMPQQPAFNPNDPDSSPDMQLAWDIWHKRVAAVIFERFNFFARAAFKHSPPLMARLSYDVTRDGQIINVSMAQKSNNVLFNVLVFQAVKSLNGDQNVLPYPQGSRRMSVHKTGTFTQNYGQEGFRYQVGDTERVPGR